MTDVTPRASPGQPAESATRPARVPRPLADSLIREIGGWLEGDDPNRVAATTRAWDGGKAAAARRLMTAHGVAAFLARDATAARVMAVLPEDVQAWLADQAEANRARVDRLQEELAAVLRSLAAAGVPTMPLKGALLWARPGGDPYRRPMADLDLLVRPTDRGAARTALTSLGYLRDESRHRRPTHDTFVLPGNERLVTLDGEHPDNPRRIELHVEVKRHLWAWVDDDDLTELLWTGSRPSTIVGEPAIVPTDLALLGHLSIHATSDLLLARGRLIQLVDTAEVAAAIASSGDTGERLEDLPHPRLVLPSLVLATRLLPKRTAPVGPDGLARLVARVPVRLARWAARVALDTRAGLQSGWILPADVDTLAARWDRWAPYTWRLLVAHGDIPMPLAAARHAVQLLKVAASRPA